MRHRRAGFLGAAQDGLIECGDADAVTLADNDEAPAWALFARLWHDRLRRILLDPLTDPRLVSLA